MNYIEKVQSYSPIAYWPMNESSGSDALDYSGNGYTGSYTGVTLGQTGIGDGETCPFFDGANDFNDVYSTGLRDAFDGEEGTFSIWVKVNNVGVWTDGAERAGFYFYVNGTNNIYIRRQTTNNRLRFMYNANGTLKFLDADGLSNIDWTHLAFSWSKGADEVKAYINGPQQGATQTGLGAWAGVLQSTNTAIGSEGSGGGQNWHGWLAHPAVWDSALTPSQIADLATAAVGDTYWGHITGVVENPRTFANNWAGSATIVGSGDGEQVCISAGENMVSEVVDTGLYTVEVVQNEYDGTGDNITLSYRHSGTVAGCQAASWVPYSTPFASLGFVQVRTTPS